LSIIVFFSLNFSVFDMFLFLKKFCSIKYVLLAFFILSCKSVWLLLSSGWGFYDGLTPQLRKKIYCYEFLEGNPSIIQGLLILSADQSVKWEDG
jgi:hypothetical protein